MLAGISQAVFLKNWGKPDSEISLRTLGRLCDRGTLYLSVKSGDKADYSVWIYKSKDRILFFTESRLRCHFKWSGFDEERNKVKNVNNHRTRNLRQSVMVQSLALVA
jgi:hypothetical protein